MSTRTPSDHPTQPPPDLATARSRPDTGIARPVRIGDSVTWGSRNVCFDVATVLSTGVRVRVAGSVTHFIGWGGNGAGPLVHANGDRIDGDRLGSSEWAIWAARSDKLRHDSRIARTARALFGTDPEVIAFLMSRAEIDPSGAEENPEAVPRLDQVEDIAWQRGIDGFEPETRWVASARIRAISLAGRLSEKEER